MCSIQCVYSIVLGYRHNASMFVTVHAAISSIYQHVVRVCTGSCVITSQVVHADM